MVILHVEDNWDFCEIVKSVCGTRHEVFNSLALPQAFDALDIIPKIDLIISDFQLGHETCEKFFEFLTISNSTIPAIIYSAYDSKKIAELIKYKNLLAIIPKAEFVQLKECVENIDEKIN